MLVVHLCKHIMSDEWRLPYMFHYSDYYHFNTDSNYFQWQQLKGLSVSGLIFTSAVFCFSSVSATNWIGLRKLEELDVSDNCLSSLPTAVLHCLKSLILLNVCRNKLSSFPEPWVCSLVRNWTAVIHFLFGISADSDAVVWGFAGT